MAQQVLAPAGGGQLRHGLHTDVSVIGFDDQPDVADQVRPSLITVELPHLLMGRRAGELLLAESTNPIERLTVPCTLIRRDSLGPPSTRRRRPRRSTAPAA